MAFYLWPATRLHTMVKIFGPLASHHASGHMTAPKIYSSSLRNRRNRQAPPAPPPPPPCDLEVTGTLWPDATGCYNQTDTYEGQPFYTRDDGNQFIWYQFRFWVPSHHWYITETMPLNLGDYYWAKDSDTFETEPGTYTPYGGTGTATVAEG